MSTTGIPVIKFMFREEIKVLKEALSLQPAYEVEEFSSANDLSTYMSTVNAGLIITSLRDKNDLIQIATFMKIAKKVAKDTIFKVVVFNYSGEKSFEKAIAKLGIQDLVEPGINTKALKFKLEFWMKALNAQIKNNPNANAQKSVKSLEANKAAANDKKAPDSQTPVWQEPLDLEDDVWIIKNEADCKKVLSKWLIKLIGPGPYAGSWAELKPGHWRFDFKESEKELYVSGNGSWFFSGEQKPDFVWKENVWLVTGENFDLYYKDQNQVISRFKSKDRVLTICKNSLFAKTKELVIIESFNKELVFKREAEQLEDLEGKNKTDQLGNGHLSGKNKGGSNIGGNLAGDVEGEEPITQDNLTQKTKTEKTSKFWNSKNSYQQDAENDGSSAKADGPRDGSDLERERSDIDHQKYYKNHNEAQKYDPSGPLSGKLTPEEESEGDNGSEQSRERKTQLRSVQRGKVGESSKAEEQSPMGGKSSTDKIASHYGRTNHNASAATEKEAKSKDALEGTPGQKPELSKAEKDQLEALKRAANAATQKSSKTPLVRNWDAEHGYEMKDDHTDEKSSVLPFNKKEEEKNRPKTQEEKELDEITKDAKVVSFMTQNNKKIECSLDDFFDNTIIFHTEDKEIKTSGKVSLDLLFKFLQKDSKLRMEGNVISVENDGEGMNYVTVQVSNENAVSLDTFMRLYEMRQDNVNEFMKKAKGL